jgi:hypothetical protein
LRRRWAAAVPAITALLAACSGQPILPTAGTPTAPPGWIQTVGGGSDLRVTLPPWLVVFDTTGAIFANEVVGAGGQGLQLMAEGPATANPQPRTGEDLARWLERKVGGAQLGGTPTFSYAELPTGRAVHLQRLDRAGTGTAWRISAYAIPTLHGVVFLMIDGPADAWAAHEDDARLIPSLIDVAEGRRSGGAERGPWRTAPSARGAQA